MTSNTDEGISRLMKGLGQRHVQYINRRHGRTGTLFDGRFRSSVVEADAYLLACQRYIELNPVRAGMVEAPGDYPWSSYGANALGVADVLITPHSLYTELAKSNEQRQCAYRALFSDTLGDDLLKRIRDSANGGFVLRNSGLDPCLIIQTTNPADPRIVQPNMVARQDPIFPIFPIFQHISIHNGQ